MPNVVFGKTSWNDILLDHGLQARKYLSITGFWILLYYALKKVSETDGILRVFVKPDQWVTLAATISCNTTKIYWIVNCKKSVVIGFPDLCSGQKSWWNWCLTPVANFGEVRRAQLARSTLLTSRWCPWDFFRSFKVCSDAKERVGCGKQREAIAPIKSLVKLQPWFLSLRWKTCLRHNCSLGFSTCSEGPAFGQTWWWSQNLRNWEIMCYLFVFSVIIMF